jgi:hypothetical protein
MWQLGLNVVDMMRIVMVFGHYGGSPIIQKGGGGGEGENPPRISFLCLG